MTSCQSTIERPVEVSGRGLHTGAPVSLRFLPADPGQGLAFRRTDLPGAPRIPAHIDAVSGSQVRHTVLGFGDAVVHTPEHVLASCVGLGLSNLTIEIDGAESPATDGSALPFTKALREAGRVDQEPPAPRLAIRHPVHLELKNSGLWALPNPGGGLTLSYRLCYDHAGLRDQTVTFSITPDAFESDIAPARTFCLKQEVEMLRKAGFGKGADLKNTLVVDDDGSVIENELRFADEFARHKLLDLLGDLALVGRRLEAHIVADRTGHAANHQLVQRILDEFADPAASEGFLNIRDLQRVLPHRYPFLLVDRIEAVKGGDTAVGHKLVTGTEEYFQGHFPGEPLMPGVLQLESMAQVAGALLLNQHQYHGKISVIVSIDKVRFRRPVVPGDRLRIIAETQLVKKRTAQVWTYADVDGARVSEARFRFMLTQDKEAP